MKNEFEDIKAAMQQAVAVSHGKAQGARVSVRTIESVAEVRKQLNLSRAEFAKIFGVSLQTVEGWEKGTKKPSGAARTLLRVARQNPRAVLDSMHSL